MDFFQAESYGIVSALCKPLAKAGISIELTSYAFDYVLVPESQLVRDLFFFGFLILIWHR